MNYNNVSHFVAEYFCEWNEPQIYAQLNKILSNSAKRKRRFLLYKLLKLSQWRNLVHTLKLEAIQIESKQRFRMLRIQRG